MRKKTHDNKIGNIDLSMYVLKSCVERLETIDMDKQ